MAQQPQYAAGGSGDSSVAEQALGKGLQVGVGAASAGFGLAKAGAGKGLAVVKEMDPGQIGLVIKLLNIGTGLAIAGWAGALLVVEILGYFGCASEGADCGGECGECCPKHPEATTCDAPMSLMGNISQLVISIYMIPLGTILILYEVSTKRVGSEESVAQPTGIWAKLAAFRESLMLYFGFIFFYKRRTQYLVFVGILCMGNRTVDSDNPPSGQGSWAPVIAGLLALLDALLHFAVRLQHPEFDQSMQQALSAADDEAMGREVAGGAVAPPAGGGGQQYMP